MKITKQLWRDKFCPNGIDCETVYDTDGTEVGVRFRWDKVLTDEQAAALGVNLPAHEGMLLFPREGWSR